jgi:S1-C subfamily serine protease
MIRLQPAYRNRVTSMDRAQIEAVLDAAEDAVSSGSPVGPTRFWKAVAAVKADPALVESYADRIARIDRAALKDWALITIPLWLGNVLAVGATLIGLVLVAWAYSLEGTTGGITFLIGFGIVLTTTHSLAHLITGSLMGMRFTHWFSASIRRPTPGVKVDYATYLRAPASSRAWMHASGAIVTKIMPFAFLGAAFAAGIPPWAIAALALIGVGQIVTDILWSTKASDWKKFRREMAFDQSAS